MHIPLSLQLNPPGNLTKKAGQKRCFAKISGSKNPIGPSPRLIIPGRRDASAVGYEFSVAKFFESKPRSRFFGSLARAHVGARTFWRAQKVAFSLRKNPIAPRLCVPHQTLIKDFDRRRREPQRIYFQKFSEPRLFCLWRARACTRAHFLGRFWVSKTYAKRLQS